MGTTQAPTPAAQGVVLSAYHRLRKRLHFFFFALFCILPFFNIVRFDIPKQRFYFAGYELWINEFGIIFFALMFLLFVIAGLSMIYGRVYCSYACPQMIFSEAANALQARINRLVQKKIGHWPKQGRAVVAGILLYSTLLVASTFLAFVFISYFVEPRDLLSRLMHFDIVTAGGISGAVTTILTFLDFAFLRQRFCTTVCPYGYLQGMLADDQTLLVHYRDPNHTCIECKKCVRVCHMGIDIRNSPFQIECIHCGECIDACDEILGRLKTPKPGLIHYTWGERGETTREKDKPWWYRLGVRDAKRIVVMLVLLFYASGLTVALSMRRAVLVRINPERATLYTLAPDGDVINKFRLEIANRSSNPASVRISLDQLPGARIAGVLNPLRVAPGETLRQELDIISGPAALPAGVSHFQFVAESQPEAKTDAIPMTFIMPEGKPK